MFAIVAIMMLTQQPTLPTIEGMASYYTVSSNGTRTASGERFRDDSLTCAMLDGVFGDYYRVVADNGKSVVCKLNDRGPYVDGRVIDLSKAAMGKLGLLRQGVGNVQVYHLGKNPPKDPAPVPAAKKPRSTH